MIKDKFFSSSRFMNLCRKEMVENWRTNLLRMVMVFGIMVLIFVVNGYFKYRWWPQHAETDPMVEYALNYFIILGWIFGCLFASMTFSKLRSKTSRLSLIMTPATSFEKYFSRWMISTIVYVVVFIILFMLADYARVIICRIIYPETTIMPASLKYLVTRNIGIGNAMGENLGIGKFMLSYLFTQSFFLLGSAVWPKNSFIKTFAAGLFIQITYMLIAVLTLRVLWGENIYITDSALNINPETIKNTITGIVVFFTLFNWTMAYYRFKESEIINRL